MMMMIIIIIIIIVLIIIIIIIIIIAFKGDLSPALTLKLIARAQFCAIRASHVQHIERLSRAKCRVTCHVVRRDSSAIKIARV